MISKICIIMLLLALFVGCGNNPNQRPNNRASSEVANSQSIDQNKEIAHPIRIVIFQDKTGSSSQTITPQLNVNDVEPLIEYITDNGTELGLGIIDKMSNMPLVRLFLEPPLRNFTEPADGNPFLLIKQRQEYQSKLERYNRAMDSYRVQTEAEVNSFRESAKLLLAQSPDASQTNIYDAIAKSNLYFCEDGTYQSSVKSYLVLISDGQHNAKGISRVDLKSGVKLILINGSASVGPLAYLQPKCFESFKSSIRYILADAGNKEGD
jgi:hypothetical protein